MGDHLIQFKDVFTLFPDFIRDESNGQEFNGFAEGYMYDREAYKEDWEKISLEAIDVMNRIEKAFKPLIKKYK